MARYAYDFPLRERRRRPAGRRWSDYQRDYGVPVDFDPRMGLHDFSEGYGRYSGGPRRGYEYSEQSLEHLPPYRGGLIGFTRPLRAGAGRRPEEAGRRPERAPEERAGRARAPRPREAWEAEEPRRSWWEQMPRQARDRYWQFRGHRDGGY